MRRFVKIFAAVLIGFAVGEKPAMAANKKGKPRMSISPEATPAPKFDVPIPVGHDAQVVRLPYYDTEGKLQMFISIALAKRNDAYHLLMHRAEVQTYDADGAPEMNIKLSTSTLDLNTRVITSNEPVTVRRSDFEITGERMRFDTASGEGKFIGHVRMLIYDRSSMNTDKTASTPAEQ